MSDVVATPLASPSLIDPQTTKPRRRRRWLLWLLIATVVLVIVLIVAVQVILWSDIPRARVILEVEKRLGIKMAAQSLESGWFGTTTLHAVSLSLPLADAPFAEVAEVRVEHTTLLGIALTQSVQIQSITLTDPAISIVQDSAGQWNLVDVIDQIDRATKPSGVSTSTSRRPTVALPRVSIAGGSIDVTDNQNRHAHIAPVTFQSDAADALAWRYQLRIGLDQTDPSVDVSGVLAPGGSWKHRVQFALKNLHTWAEPWVNDLLKDATLAGTWDGSIESGNFAGRMLVRSADVAGVRAESGSALSVEVEGKNIALRPESIVLKMNGRPIPDVRLSGGQLNTDGSTIHVEGVRFSMAGGSGRVDGAWSIADRSGLLQAAWDGIEYPPEIGVTHSGQIDIKLADRFPSAPEVDVKLTTRGKSEVGGWDGNINLSARGDTWQAMDVAVSVPQASWQGSKPVTVNDLQAALRVDWPRITLANVRLGQSDRLRARGAFTFGTHTDSQPSTTSPTTSAAAIVMDASTTAASTSAPALAFPTSVPSPKSDEWWLWVDGRDWPIPGLQPVAFSFSGWGQGPKYVIDDLYVATGNAWLSSKGTYSADQPSPIDARVYVASAPEFGRSDTDELPLRGKVFGNARLRGTLAPVALAFRGNLSGSDLFINNRPLQSPQLKLVGTVSGRQLEAHTRELTILDSIGQLDITYPFAGEGASARLRINDLPLENVGAFARISGLTGQAHGDWRFIIPSLRRSRISMTGDLRAEDVRWNALVIDALSARTTLENGELRIDPIHLMHADGTTRGAAFARMQFDLLHLDDLTGDLSFKDWPVRHKDGAATLSGRLHEVRVALPGADGGDMSVTGRASLASSLSFRGEALGDATLEATLAGRSVSLDRFDADLVGGHITGEARLNLDEPSQTIAQFAWSGVTPSTLSPLVPKLAELSGKFDGSLNLRPAEDARALEPIRIDLKVQPDQASFRTIALGPWKVTAFARLPIASDSEQRFRLVLDIPERNTIELASGTIHPWARLSRVGGEKMPSQFSAAFENLDLGQLVRAFKPDAQPTPGVLAGQANVLGNAGVLDQLTGGVTVQLTKSDLGNIEPFRFMYGLFNLQLAPTEPTGAGTIGVRLEQGNVTITDMDYFNRGVYARTSGLIVRDVFSLPDSPINGYVIGTARPLRDVKLPFAADVDKIFSAVQENSNTVRISGTVLNMKVEQATLAEIGDDLRRLILGDVKSK